MSHCWHRDGKLFYCCFCGYCAHMKINYGLIPDGHGEHHPDALVVDEAINYPACRGR